jgi:hypothetical protein
MLETAWKVEYLLNLRLSEPASFVAVRVIDGRYFDFMHRGTYASGFHFRDPIGFVDHFNKKVVSA